MELRHLRYFLKVCEELNFSKAAEKLFISQPPLSRQIKELETEIGAQLLERTNKRVTLTDAGVYFEQEARDLLLSLERITLKTRKIGENISGEFRIAYISSTFGGIVSELIQHLSTRYPFVSFKLFELGTARQVLELEQGKLDLGILRAPLTSSMIKTQLWYFDDYRLVYNKNQVTIESDDEIEQLKSATFVFYNKDFAPHYHNSLMQICALYGFTPNVVHESNNINSIIQLVRNGLGVSIVPESVVKNHPYAELGFVKMERNNLFTEVLLASPMHQESEVADRAIAFLKKSMEDETNKPAVTNLSDKS
ncbi:MAG: LysR family transcriptional regulator [Salinivirgaceae bacterium]